MAGHERAWQGKAGEARHGAVWHGIAGQRKVWQVRLGKLQLGKARQAWQVRAGQGVAALG